MAQYYQVTSLEELHHLYPNLQFENVEGIPCMVQENQITQINKEQVSSSFFIYILLFKMLLKN